MYGQRIMKHIVVCVLLSCCPLAALGEGSRDQTASVDETFTAVEALVDVTFNPLALKVLGLRASSGGVAEGVSTGQVYSFDMDFPQSMFQIAAVDGTFTQILDGSMDVTGDGFSLQTTDGTAVLVDALRIAPAPSNGDGFDFMLSRGEDGPEALFNLSGTQVDFDRKAQTMFLQGDLYLADAVAEALGLRDMERSSVGRFVLTARMQLMQVVHLNAEGAVTSVVLPGLGGGPEGPGTNCNSIGADVIVGDLPAIQNYSSLGGIEAFAVGTTSCNIGDTELLWESNNPNHPVIGQDMYRLKTMADGHHRFEQIGQSWLKHGFFALQGEECAAGNPNCFCTPSGAGGTRLGIGCSDPYGAGLNGSQSGLGPRAEVNPSTGVFAFPHADGNQGPSGDTVYKRIQVHISDLDPAQAGGGQYFVDGQYVTPDDAAAGNNDNNESYRACTITGSGTSWSANVAAGSTTQREQPAIRAWQDTDPTVTETDVLVPGTGGGLAIISSQATSIGGGLWHYEYAVQNLNVDRGFNFFSVPATGASGIGFHDVDYHSGDGVGGITRDGTDWVGFFNGSSVRWDMQAVAGANDNALLWGTLYNFRFDSTSPPAAAGSSVTLGLWRAGSPLTVVQSGVVGPQTGPADCNGNGVNDDQDILNGTSQDCANGGPNGIPDECEATCTLRGRQVASGLIAPLYVTSDGVNANRLYIVEQGGSIKILDLGTGTVTGTYLNIAGLITSAGEQGLLSVAFHPNFGVGSPFLFVDYTDLAGDTVIARYTATGGNPASVTADPASAVILKTIAQPFPNHNGGQLQFSPIDGMLYVGMGDGGGAEDPFENSQNNGVLLGKMLRLDVDNPPTYIPVDNPFVGPGNPLDEIWAKGLRNPWRFSFDRLTGDMLIGDVGESTREEIDFQPSTSMGGENYGWDCREGFIAAPAVDNRDCTDPPYVDPILDVVWGSAGSCAITGGHVYRGCDIPGLSGTYFYADYCGNWIRSFAFVDGDPVPPVWTDRTTELTPFIGSIDQVVSFGEDMNGELYWVNLSGSVYKIECDLPPVCGNGILEPGEECDDGNLIPGDGCNENCLIEGTCGNGIVELGETCDDGNLIPGDGCDQFCQIETSDNCVNAAPITEGTFPYDTTGANTDGPAHASCMFDGQTYHDIWFEYTPTCDGNLTVTTCDQANYDTDMVVYNGCNCGALNLLACNDDCSPCANFSSTIPCPSQSDPSVPVIAGNCYLIRVGGWDANSQGTGNVTVSNSGVPCAVCGDGILDPGEQCDDGNTVPGDGCDQFCQLEAICGNAIVEPGEQCDDGNTTPGDGCSATCQIEGDYIRGGRMYDNWWTEAGLAPPVGDHPLWAFRPDPVTNTATGAATWRCTECHGWDYLGAAGAYGPGSSHNTGFPGILGTTLNPAELHLLLLLPPSNGGGPGVLNGHDLGSTGLSSADIDDLVAFTLAGGPIDESALITAGSFNGNKAQGQINYNTLGSCAVCHGIDGTLINFTADCTSPEYVGTVSFNNPWELLHKIRFGEAASIMPSWEAGGGSVQGAVDMGEYTQNTFPVECVIGAACTQCDDANECTDDSCDGRFCTAINNTNPCMGGTGVCQGGTCVVCTEPCSDGDACTINDTCAGGPTCAGTPVDCGPFSDDCNAATCDPGGVDGNCDIVTPTHEGGPCNGGSGVCQSGVCLDPGNTRVFMVRPGFEASAPTAGPTTINMVPGGTATIEVWLADTETELLGSYEISTVASADPGVGATGTVDYIDNPDPAGCDSLLVDRTNPDWVFFNDQPDTFCSETGLPDGIAFVSFLPIGSGISVPTLAYLGEFQFASSVDADGVFTVRFIPIDLPPNGGSFLMDQTGITQILANYQPLEINVGLSLPCTTAADCADVTPADGITDDVCVWWECVGGSCVSAPKVNPSDLGGAGGTCPLDAFCNLADAQQALTCFAGDNSCDPINIDAGGAFGECAPDGFCNLADALHALTCFAGTNTCTCGGPAPESVPNVVGTASLRSVADRRTVRAGSDVQVRVFMDEAQANFRAYQLDTVVSGGRRGSLELVDITIEDRADFVFADAADDVFRAFNVERGQMLGGLFSPPPQEGVGHPRDVATGRPSYLATFTYRASADAAGAFVIDVLHDAGHGDQTYLIGAEQTDKIEVASTSPAVVVVTGGSSRSIR